MATDRPPGNQPLAMRPSFVALYGNRTMLVLLALGFAGGLPNVMVTKVAQAWTSAAHWDVAAIGALSAWTLPYAFKFAWAPLVDSIQLPLLGRLGRRRPWTADQRKVCKWFVPRRPRSSCDGVPSAGTPGDLQAGAA